MYLQSCELGLWSSEKNLLKCLIELSITVKLIYSSLILCFTLFSTISMASKHNSS